MSPRSTIGPEQRQQPTLAEVAALADRLDVIERHQEQLKRTLRAIARESGVSIGCPCNRCQQCHMLVKHGSLSCPVCGYQESL